MNNDQITKAIKSATGLEGVKVFSGGGCCRFYSDNELTADRLGSVEMETVWVCYINQLTTQQWVEEFLGNWRTK